MILSPLSLGVYVHLILKLVFEGFSNVLRKKSSGLVLLCELTWSLLITFFTCFFLSGKSVLAQMVRIIEIVLDFRHLKFLGSLFTFPVSSSPNLS
jgi:hypothetical protein